VLVAVRYDTFRLQRLTSPSPTRAARRLRVSGSGRRAIHCKAIGAQLPIYSHVFHRSTEMVSLFLRLHRVAGAETCVRQYRVLPASESHPAQSVPIDREGEDISQVAAVEFFEREGAQVRGCGRDGGFGDC